MHARLSGGRRARNIPLRTARPWPSVKSPTVCTDRPGGPDVVRYASVDTATHRLTVTHRDTRRDKKETARRAENSQLAGRFRRWWQVLGSNQRRLSRRFFQTAPASTSTWPVTCVNTIRGCPLRRRCPPYVRAPGHPRRRSRVQVCTAPSSSPEPQAGAPPAPGSPAGERPREHHRAGLPHTRLAQPLSRRSRLVHLLPARDAPSRYFPQTRATGQRRNHPGPAPPDAANAPDRSRPARERPRHKSPSNRPIVRICR
jgi:hypothetical protein